MFSLQKHFIYEYNSEGMSVKEIPGNVREGERKKERKKETG